MDRPPETENVEMDYLATNLDLSFLLQKAGAEPGRIGKRWNCPSCGKPNHVSVDFGKGVYHCWHAGCDFHGSRFTLAKSLGFASPSNDQQRQYAKQRQSAQRAAEIEYARRMQRRQELYFDHRELLSMLYAESRRLQSGSGDEASWAALAIAYRQLSRVRAELLLLEDAPFAARRAFMRADRPQREAAIDQVVERGGLLSEYGKFLELREVR